MKSKDLDVEDFILIRFSLSEQIEKTKQSIIYYDSMIRAISSKTENHPVYTVEGFEKQKSSSKKHLKKLVKLLAFLEQGDKLTMIFKQ